MLTGPADFKAWNARGRTRFASGFFVFVPSPASGCSL